MIHKSDNIEMPKTHFHSTYVLAYESVQPDPKLSRFKDNLGSLKNDFFERDIFSKVNSDRNLTTEEDMNKLIREGKSEKEIEEILKKEYDNYQDMFALDCEKGQNNKFTGFDFVQYKNRFDTFKHNKEKHEMEKMKNSMYPVVKNHLAGLFHECTETAKSQKSLVDRKIQNENLIKKAEGERKNQEDLKLELDKKMEEERIAMEKQARLLDKSSLQASLANGSLANSIMADGQPKAKSTLKKKMNLNRQSTNDANRMLPVYSGEESNKYFEFDRYDHDEYPYKEMEEMESEDNNHLEDNNPFADVLAISALMNANRKKKLLEEARANNKVAKSPGKSLGPNSKTLASKDGQSP